MVTWRAVHVKIPLLRYFSRCPSTNGNKTFRRCEDTGNIWALFRERRGGGMEQGAAPAPRLFQTFLSLFWSWVDEMGQWWMAEDRSQSRRKKGLIGDIQQSSAASQGFCFSIWRKERGQTGHRWVSVNRVGRRWRQIRRRRRVSS